MTQLSNVLMQPKPDAVERPQALIEKLEQKRDHHNHFLETCRNDRDKAYHSFGKKCYQEAINIVKQHQAESWVSVGERLPEREYCEYLVWVGYPDIATYSKFGWELPSDAVITHWMPLPKPPSEVQDDE